MRDVRLRQQAALDLFRDHRSLHLTYEELCQSRSATLARVQKFLEVRRSRLAALMVKVIEKNTDLVLNLAEAQVALADERGPAEARLT